MAIQPGPGYTFSASSLGENINIQQPWSEWDTSGPRCPFTIYSAGTVTPEGEDPQYMFSAVPGHVNNLVPILGIGIDPAMRLNQSPTPKTPFNFDEEGNSWIYLKVSTDGTDYPVTVPTDILYPRIISNSIEQTDTEDSGFMLLAQAFQDTETKAITISQLTCGSIWTVRFKCGDDPATYWWSAV